MESQGPDMWRGSDYGKMKEWGQLQFQVMTALDFLMDDNIGAAKDTVALLAVTGGPR